MTIYGSFYSLLDRAYKQKETQFGISFIHSIRDAFKRNKNIGIQYFGKLCESVASSGNNRRYIERKPTGCNALRYVRRKRYGISFFKILSLFYS